MQEDQIKEKLNKIKSRRGLQSYEKQELINSLYSLHKKELPILLDLRDFSEHIRVQPKELASILNATERFYRSFEIPKRSGGQREILAPFPSLSMIQQWIATHILSHIEIHASAVAYKKNTSIKNHVEPHLNNPTLLKLDIRNFFPSISTARVSKEFLELGYTSKISYALARFSTLHDSVPQGAPSSPLISNIVLRKVDAEIEQLSNVTGITYTRYADDFAFSGTEFPANFSAQISAILDAEGFDVNYAKTRLYEPHEKTRFLTGLSISSGRIRPPKSYRRWVTQKIHYLEKHIEADLTGFSNTTNSEILNNPFILESLRGKIGYWNWVDPFDKTAIDCLIKLNKIEMKLMQI